MLNKLYQKSQIWFAVAFIVAYVIGNSCLISASESIGYPFVYTIPYNFMLLAILFGFFKRNHLFETYGIHAVRCKASKLLYYVPLVLIATVNLWTGMEFRMNPVSSIIYVTAMLLTGVAEEMLFRGLLFQAMAKNNLRNAVIVTSVTFGMGHIVNLVNGNSAYLAETICQLFYAVAIGFLLAAVLCAGKSILPCIATHSILNALSAFANEAEGEKMLVPISAVLCVISAVSAIIIFKNISGEE